MQSPRIGAFAISCALHGAAIALALVFVANTGESDNATPDLSPLDPPLMVWLPQPGPGGGGGGGGNDNPDPARAAKLRGADVTTMPVASRTALDARGKTDPLPGQTLDVPAQNFADSDLDAMGLVAAGTDSLSQGPGRRGGAGTGDGIGNGPGDGPGLGPGEGGGTGGGAFRPGSGVTMPVPIHQEKPKYTVAAMRARIQGDVVIECVVQPTGECSRFRVLRSLDARLGLDDQAMRAAAGWRFSPGTLQGKPVPVLVTIQLAFAIH